MFPSNKVGQLLWRSTTLMTPAAAVLANAKIYRTVLFSLSLFLPGVSSRIFQVHQERGGHWRGGVEMGRKGKNQCLLT